jgi:AhpD family alkylhydroperoxidase
MQVIQPIRIDEAAGSTRRLLETASNELRAFPNMFKTMAQSPFALEGYLKFARSLAAGSLTPELRERIALVVAQTNHCDYSLTRHASLSGRLGLSGDEIRAARELRAGDMKTTAALRFARDLIDRNGDCSTVELREAGYGDAEIVEIVAYVALNLFENYFNTVAQTELDLPLEAPKVVAA